jgi:Calcineurin-like phosphoesterase
MKSKLFFTLILLTTAMTIAQTEISMSGENSFIKNPYKHNTEKFTFAILGDKTNGGELNWPIFDRAVSEINLLHPDFVIMIGDMIQGVTTDTNFINDMWKEFRSHADKLDVPLYLLPGNHDISNKIMYDYWNNKIGLRYYSFVHKNSLFILLNTEEYRNDINGQLGKAQLDFIMEQLNSNKNVNETFIFLHRPIWYDSDSTNAGYEEWQIINSGIKKRKVTVFAGHWHNLVYNKIDDIRHIVLSATGGNLEEKELPELGYFHHYSFVTVDKDTSIISLIKPGSIFPEDIANEKFLSKFNNMIEVDNTLNAKHDEIVLGSKISINNLLDKNIEYKVSVDNKDNSYWKFDQREIIGNLGINETVNYELSSGNGIENSIPFPSIECSIYIEGNFAETISFSFAPSGDDTWRYPKNVMILGGFDLGISKKPMIEKDVEKTQISPKADWMNDRKYISENNNENIKWHEADVSDGNIALDDYVDRIDFAVGYISFIIESNEQKNVLASLKPDNYAQVYQNGKLVLQGNPYKGVPSVPYMFLLNLRKGENTILIKTANYYGSWYVDFKVSDPEENLVFKIKK